MTSFKPRCPALHPDLPYSRCGREEGHGLLHRNFTGLEWENTMHPDGRLTWSNRDDAEGGVTCAAIENETEGVPLSEHLRKLSIASHQAQQAEKDAAHWRERAEKAEIALADVHERDETIARLEQRLTEAEYHRYSWKSAALRAEQPRPHQPQGALMTDPLDALADWHERHADQADFDGDHGRAKIHQWAAVQAINFKEEQS